MFNFLRNVKNCAAALILSLGVSTSANAALMQYQVGAGDSTAHVLINFYDQDNQTAGEEFLFEVKFNTVTTGLGLLDIIELASALDPSIPDVSTARTFFPEGQFPADVFLNQITVGSESNTNEPWPGKYWGYYNRNQAGVAWDFSGTGPGNRFVEDGQWDAWTFTGGLPTGVSVPEPASIALVALGGVLLLARKK